MEIAEDRRMYVRSVFTPLRLMAGNRDPVSLAVYVANKSDGVRNYSVTVKVPTTFGFDRTGMMHDQRNRIRAVQPGQTGETAFTIYGKFSVKHGFYPFSILVREHDERFDKTFDEKVLVTKLRIE